MYINFDDIHEITNAKSSRIKSVWSMQSKFFDKSVKRTPNTLPLSIDFLNFSGITKSLRWEQYPSQKSLWLGNTFLTLK